MDDVFDPKNEVKTDEKVFIAMRKEGKIYVSDFPNGKVLSTITDTAKENEKVIYLTSRTQIKATYISAKDQIVELKIQKFDVKGGELQQPVEIRIDTGNLATLTNFLQFLLSANLASVSAGRLSFEKNLSLDPELESKLHALAQDEEGKKQIVKLYEEGYLTSGLDIPELIKSGLTKNKIEEKRKSISDFREMLSRPEVKEVTDIQNFLKEHPWMLGPEYKSLDFRTAGFAGNPDGRLLRIDGLSDILEVKLPSEELLRADERGRQYISPKLAESLGQLSGYLEFYYSEYSHERDDTTGDEVLEDRLGKYYKPRGILLIGRRGLETVNTMAQTIPAKPKYLRRLLSYFHWIEVLTYDDLLERAENGLDNLTA